MSLVYPVHKAGSCTDAFCVAACNQSSPLVQFAASPRQRIWTEYTALNIISYLHHLFKKKVSESLFQCTTVNNCVITYHICSICWKLFFSPLQTQVTRKKKKLFIERQIFAGETKDIFFQIVFNKRNINTQVILWHAHKRQNESPDLVNVEATVPLLVSSKTL
jgi:hypothetical protein